MFNFNSIVKIDFIKKSNGIISSSLFENLCAELKELMDQIDAKSLGRRQYKSQGIVFLFDKYSIPNGKIFEMNYNYHSMTPEKLHTYGFGLCSLD
jgi:hypothetical protein